MLTCGNLTRISEWMVGSGLQPSGSRSAWRRLRAGCASKDERSESLSVSVSVSGAFPERSLERRCNVPTSVFGTGLERSFTLVL